MLKCINSNEVFIDRVKHPVNRFQRVILFLLLSLVTGIFFHVHAPAASGGTGGSLPEVQADPRVELLGIIFRLAGNPEYNKCRIPSYNKDIETWFSAYKDHEAVRIARKLRRTRGVSFDAVMSLAVHLSDADTLQERVQLMLRPDELDRRWKITEAREFLYAARKFVKDSRFNRFIKNHRSLYDSAVSRMKSVIKKSRVHWLDRFFGRRANSRLIVVPALVNGDRAYAARMKPTDGQEELYCILGAWLTDSNGLPRFDDTVLPFVIHEFSHSYINPLVDKYRSRLRNAGQRIFPYVETIMKRQYYTTWKIMTYESLVRAGVVRYMNALNGPQAAEKQIKEEEKNGFPWVKELSRLLGEYEASRNTYPDLDAFILKITAFFNDYAKTMEQTPRVVSMIPANGAVDVDPGLQAITIRFSRPMRDRSWSVVGVGGQTPQITGQPVYHSNRMILTLPVKLQPGQVYEFGLNSATHFNFASEEGVPLMPVRVRFSTRGK
ncbi:MAG: DUF4932 domain-containing protein [bacterium]|nr:DUF4932 domain-containing protein [bacterium]